MTSQAHNNHDLRSFTWSTGWGDQIKNGWIQVRLFLTKCCKYQLLFQTSQVTITHHSVILLMFRWQRMHWLPNLVQKQFYLHGSICKRSMWHICHFGFRPTQNNKFSKGAWVVNTEDYRLDFFATWPLIAWKQPCVIFLWIKKNIW